MLGASLTSITVILKLDSEVDTSPSLTLITIPLAAPTFELSGFPVRVPVEGLKLAQSGLLVIENVRWSPSGSIALGVNP
jgi:hypothetical protein